MTVSGSVPAWVDPALQVSGRRPWRKVHLDFHNTPAVGAIGADFDPDEFVATLRRGHVDAIVVFAKDMHGYFYYPAARAEAVHPGLDRDLMGEQIAACRAAGIRVYTYYCTGWDNLLADTHPEWLVFKRDRTSYLPKFDQTPGWTALCMRNPDFLQLMLDDTRDLVTRYPMDGVWYDMPFPIDGECFCHLCLAALRSQGLDPLDVEVQRRDKQELLTSWMRRSSELIESLRPGCEVDQNNQTRLGLGERAPYLSNVDIEALPTGGWGYHYYPVDVRYARTFGTPVTGMTGRFHQAWADFGGLKHPEQLRVELAGIVAQGAQICIGDQAPPSGRLDAAVYDTIGRAYAEIEELQPYLDGAAPVVEAAIVASGQLLADPGRIAPDPAQNNPDQSTSADRWARGVAGLAELLLDHRVQFDVVEADADLSRYRLVVVPDGARVTDELAATLQGRLDRDEPVIVAGNALRTFDPVTGGPGSQSWLKGVGFAGRSAFSTAYLVPDESISTSIASFPYALYGGTEQYLVDDVEATVLARVGEPMFERTPEHFTSHSYSPYAHSTDYAAAWHRGALGALGFDVGADYLRSAYWVYRDLFGLLLDAVLPDRLLSTDLGRAVEVSLTQQKTADGPRTLIHLIPSYTGRRWGQRNDFYDVQPALSDVTLSLSADLPVSRAATLRGGGPVSLDRDGERTRLVVSRLQGPEIVALT
ncbi:MAG: alpha-L-fucosidase [Propionibacteriaceae bacterium]